MRQNNRVDILALEKIDIASLLLFIRHIKNTVRETFLIFLEAILQSQILLLEILEEHCILHLLLEFFVLQTAVLYKRCNVVPILFIVLSLGLTHTGQLFRDLFGDVSTDLLHKAVVLKSGARYIERQIRAVDYTL